MTPGEESELGQSASRTGVAIAAGRARDAAERYPGSLLPGSEAPGVVRERERLDRGLRQAVMASDDPQAVWAWVQTPTGPTTSAPTA